MRHLTCLFLLLAIPSCAPDATVGDDSGDDAPSATDARPPGGDPCEPGAGDDVGCAADAGPGPGVDDPDAGPGDPDVIDVDLFFVGDCVTAACPTTHPYPVGCDVSFSPGDDRGCVASTPSSSTVYFQAGDECDAGLVGGTLRCAVAPGAPLDATTCSINKPIPIYATAPSGCPDTH